MSMSEWQKYKLGEVYSFSSGLSKSSDQFGYGFDFLTFKDVFNNYFLPDKLTALVNSTEKERQTCSIKRGDVFLTRTSETDDELGMSSVALKDYPNATFNGFTKRLRPLGNVEIYPEFVAYYFRSPRFRANIVGMSSITTRASLNNSMLAELPLLLPNYEEQVRIATILKCLDDKIDLLHRENTTLEAMAETLFRQWFIEEAKEDWEEGKLGDEFEFIMGQSPSGESFNEEGAGIPMYQGNADFGFRFPTKRIFTTQPTKFAEINDTLISVRAPVGAQNMATEKCCIGRGVAAFRYKHNHDFYSYTYYKLKSLLEEIKQYNDNGTVFGSISKSDFENIDIVIPDINTIQHFQEQVKPIDDKIINNNKQIQTLILQRDSLLPKLMSGEVKI